MCFALFMIMLDNTVVNVALPSIQRDLHASLSALEWTVQAYTLTFAVLLVTGGRLGDIFGRRQHVPVRRDRVRTARAIIGLAPNDTMLVAFRAVQGVGAALHDARDPGDHHPGVPGRMSAARRSAPGPAFSALALAIGPVVGGFLTQDVELARDLLHQPADRRDRRRRDAVRAPRRPATRPSTGRSTTPGSPR